MLNGVKLVIFDCDGVLIDSESIYIRAIISALADFGVALDFDDAVRRYAGRNINTTADIEERFNVKLPLAYRERRRRNCAEMFETQLTAMPGVADLAAALPVKRCVASGSSLALLEKTLGLTGLWPVFAPHIFSSEQVAFGKPEPDLFLFAAAQMGVTPDECLVIEDSTFGVQAARAAKMRVIGYTGATHCPPGHDKVLKGEGAEEVFADHNEIAKAFGLSLTGQHP